jgi:hypothetical protein
MLHPAGFRQIVPDSAFTFSKVIEPVRPMHSSVTKEGQL